MDNQLNEETNFTISINSELFSEDIDNLGFEPEVIDDSCEEAAELYDYHNNH